MEPSIILDMHRTHNTCIPLEFKNRSCSERNITKMKTTLRKPKAPFGFIICRDRTGIEKGNIFLLPP